MDGRLKERGMDEQSQQTPPDATLVHAAAAGETGAFDRLVDRYMGSVYAVAYARLRHRESAEDLAQEVFLRAYLNLGALRDGDLFGLWVCRLARNLSVDWLRRGIRASRLIQLVPMEEETLNEQPDTTRPGSADQIAAREAEAGIHRDLEQLAGEQREVLLLHYFEGLSKSEIARRLGLHPSSVGRQLDRALLTLRESALSREGAAPQFPRCRPATRARTCALIGAAAALTAAQRSALAATAAAWADPVAQGVLAPAAQSLATASIPAAFKSILCEGAVLLAKSKLTVAAVALAAVAGTSYVALHHGDSSVAAGIHATGTVTTPDGAPTVPVRHDWVVGNETTFLIPYGQSIEVICKDANVDFGRYVAGAAADGTLWQRHVGPDGQEIRTQIKVTDPPSPDNPFGGDKAFGFLSPTKRGEPFSVYYGAWYRATPGGIEARVIARSSPQLVADMQALAGRYLKGQISQAQFRGGLADSLQRNSLLPADPEFRQQVLNAVRLFPVAAVVK